MYGLAFSQLHFTGEEDALLVEINRSADGRIAPRSGLASKHFIDTGAGVIDADYRGQVKVLLFNHAETEYRVQEGDRVAQLVLERVCYASVRGGLLCCGWGCVGWG